MKYAGTIIFWICLAISAGLLIAGFVVPPTGTIDGTVLSGVGELFAFAALGEVPVLVREAKSAKITTGNKTIEITGNGSGKHDADPVDN